MPALKKKVRRGLFSRNFWGSLSAVNLLNWVATLLVLAILGILATGRAGSNPAESLLAQQLTVALLGVHGIWLCCRRAGMPKFEVSILWGLPLVLWVVLEAMFLSPRPLTGLAVAGTLVQALVICWVVAHQVVQSGQIRILCAGWVALVVLAALVGLCQYLDFSYMLPPEWANYAEMDGRGAGPFYNATALGLIILSVLFPLLAFALVRWFTPVPRLFFGYLCLLLLLCFFSTFSVAAVAGLIVGILLLPKAVGTSRQKRFAWWLFGGAFLMAVMLIVSESDTLFEAGKSEILWRDVGSRPVWVAAAAAGGDELLLGAGSGTFGDRFEAYRPDVFGYEVESAGSAIATVWAEYGLIGCVLLLIPAIWFPLLWRRWYRAWHWYSREELIRRHRRVQPEKVLIASFVCALFGVALPLLAVDGFSMPLVWACCGVLAGFVFQVGSGDRGVVEKTLPVRWRLCWSGMILLVAVGWLVIIGPATEAMRAVTSADRLVRKAQGSLLVLSGDDNLLGQARFELEQALELRPDDAGIWTRLAWVDILCSYRDPAEVSRLGGGVIASSDRALELFPDSCRARFTHGVGLWMTGDRSGAQEQLEEVLEMAPNEFYTNYYLGALLFSLGETDAARECLAQAGQMRPDDEALRRLRQIHSIPGRIGRRTGSAVTLPPLPAPGSLLYGANGEK